MKIEEMKELKREWGYTNEQISEETGVAVGTVQKIFSGETKSPRRETIEALEKLFCSEHHSVYPGPVYDFPPEGKPILVKEANPDEIYDIMDYNNYESTLQGNYTAEDLENWLADRRLELIDGRIYNLAAAKLTHEIIVKELLTDLNSFTRKSKRSCLVLGSNAGVNIDSNQKTVLLPDITILCDHKKINWDDEHIWGGPDLVIEVLSPSTRRKDMTLKLHKYASRGVREYWIIDPDKKQIIVYDFAHGDQVSFYSFHDKVPVGIWDGECEIDFAQISEYLESVFAGAAD